MNIQEKLNHKADTLSEALGCSQEELSSFEDNLKNIISNKKIDKASLLIEEARNNFSYNELLVAFGVLCKAIKRSAK